MYDNYLFCKEHKDLKDLLAAIMNGELSEIDIDSIRQHINKLYASDKMSGTQYDDLMRLLQDIDI